MQIKTTAFVAALIAVASIYGCSAEREVLTEKEVLDKCMFILEWSGDGKNPERIKDELLKIDGFCKEYPARFPDGKHVGLINDLRTHVTQFGQVYKIAGFGQWQGARTAEPGNAVQSSPVAQMVGRRGAKYRPYAIVSSKLNAQLDSDTLERELLCKNSLENMEFSAKLLADYDLRDTAGDSSMGYVSFAGVSESQPVIVSIFTDHQERLVKYIALDGDTVVTCDR